jgi:hypothetical protein
VWIVISAVFGKNTGTQAAKRKRNLPRNNAAVPRTGKSTRQEMFRSRFADMFGKLKRRHGSGLYSWAEGMSRRTARRIARDVARRKV